MPPDSLIAIHSELAHIRAILTVISYLGGIALVLVIIRGCFAGIREYRSFMDKQFSREADALLNENKLGELKTLALCRLKEQPNHEYARWYLARALYLTDDYDDAIREFAYLQRICPTWKVEHIDPYLHEIEKRRQGSEPAANPSFGGATGP
jgi:hypothetical protein